MLRLWATAKCAVAVMDKRRAFLRATEILEEIMKTKLMVVMVTLLFAVSIMAQAASPAAPAAPADKSSGCSCCSDKCPMGKDGKMADGKSCCAEGCCTDGKCNMTAQKMVRADAAATSAS